MSRRRIYLEPLTGAEKTRRYRLKRKYGAEKMAEITEAQRSLIVPAPTDRAALIAQRKTQYSVRHLNDHVEDAFVALYDATEHPKFVQLVQAVFNSDAVEGSCVADDYEAARYMRDYAKKAEVPVIPEKNLHTVLQSLRVIMKRFAMSRRERRGMVHGQKVDLNGDQSDLGLSDEG